MSHPDSTGPICPECQGENGRHYSDCEIIAARERSRPSPETLREEWSRVAVNHPAGFDVSAWLLAERNGTPCEESAEKQAWEAGRKYGHQESILAVGTVCDAIHHPGMKHLSVAFQNAIRDLGNL